MRGRSKQKYNKTGRKRAQQHVSIREVSYGAANGGNESTNEPYEDGGKYTEVEVEVKDGDISGYRTTPEYLHLREFYGYWVHSNDGGHLSGGVADNDIWKTW